MVAKVSRGAEIFRDIREREPLHIREKPLVVGHVALWPSPTAPATRHARRTARTSAHSIGKLPGNLLLNSSLGPDCRQSPSRLYETDINTFAADRNVPPTELNPYHQTSGSRNVCISAKCCICQQLRFHSISGTVSSDVGELEKSAY